MTNEFCGSAKFQPLGSTKEEWLEKDRKYVWHHISPHNDHPMIAVSGEGSWITDQDGTRYLDAMSGLWCVNVGHGREEIARSAYEQMKALAYVPMTQSHEPAILLAEKLNEWLEGSIEYSSPTQVQMRMRWLSK